MSRLSGPRSIQCPGFASGRSAFTATSSPGSRTSSVVALSTGIPLLVLLPCASDGQSVGRDILGDHRSGRDPRIISDRDGGKEGIVDAGPDVAPDRRALLALTLLVREVRGDVAGGDIRVLADVRIADVRQMRDLR